MSYAIPTNELTLTDRKNFVNGAIKAGITRALALGIARSELELVVREAHPGTDFTNPPGSGWTNEYYITPGAAGALAWALAPDTGLPPQLGRNQVAVFYKIMDAAHNPVVTAVRFRVGLTGASTKASFFIQQFIDIKLEPEVYLTEPVVYDPEDWLFIEFYGRVATALAGEELSFGCFIVERLGGTIS
jgi:hypothetical protein